MQSTGLSCDVRYDSVEAMDGISEAADELREDGGIMLIVRQYDEGGPRGQGSSREVGSVWFVEQGGFIFVLVVVNSVGNGHSRGVWSGSGCIVGVGHCSVVEGAVVMLAEVTVFEGVRLGEVVPEQEPEMTESLLGSELEMFAAAVFFAGRELVVDGGRRSIWW